MELRPFFLERYFAPREFAVKAHLSSSDCEAVTLQEVVAGADEELRAQWSSLRLGYSEVAGSRLLREEVAKLDGVDPAHVLCCAPSEGIFLSMLALLTAGDVVVAVEPGYQSLSEIARGQGCIVRPWRPVEERGAWRFDPDDLARLVSGARLVVVNFPHNPTGAHPTPDEWRAIVAHVERAGAWLFADEMYRFLERSDDARLPTAVRCAPRTIALAGLSKAFSAPGLRQGWIVCDDDRVRARVAEIKDYTTICGNGPGEVLATMVLRASSRILADNRARIARACDAVDAVAATGALQWARPRAGCTALARVADPRGAAALCDDLFSLRSVLALPSTVFELPDRWIRLGLGRESFPAVLSDVAPLLRSA